MRGLWRRWMAALVALPVLAGLLLVVPATTAAAAETGSISGRVTSDAGGGALGDVEVTIYEWDAMGEYWSYVSWTTTGSDGSYSVTGLPAGEYRIGFSDYSNGHIGEYFDNVATLDDATGIQVGAGASVTGKDASLTMGGSISGRVTSDAGGAALSDIQATAQPATPGGSEATGRRRETKPRRRGGTRSMWCRGS